MKQSPATFSSLLLLGSFGSFRFLAAQMRDLSLHFDLRDEEELHFC